VGSLLGYKDPGRISRHERATSIPPLAAALAYELIFRAPIATIFSGMRDAIAGDVEEKLKKMRATLENRDARDRNANLTAQKLAWLNERQKKPSEKLTFKA
jgi:hypothetical protein